jgi:hypothetical protein
MAKINLAIVAESTKRASGAFDDQSTIDRSLTAEIVIALCGPLGTPLHEVAETFKQLLESADYGYEKVIVLRLSDEIRELSGLDVKRQDVVS